MYRISLISGDGVGPELSKSAISVLDAIGEGTGPKFDVTVLPAGDCALAETGRALPDQTIAHIKESDACLKAPVGESAADVIVVLRRMLDLYANMRPAKSYPGMPALREDIDLVIVRENTEDLYIGKEFSLGDSAVALRVISEKASRRIARHAFETAMRRGGKRKVTCVHKSNVMRVTDGLFAAACADVSRDYPDVSFDEMYVDACAMNMIRRPQEFDVIVTTNLFGDILSDESSQVVGGLGMAPAANIGESFALFEPVHGAAFDIAGRNEVNPSSFLLSIRMMLDWLGVKHNDPACTYAGERLESAIFDLVKSGVATRDLGGDATTSGFTSRVIKSL